MTFLAVMGPGLIVMEADNDAGAVSTYVQAGAQYGTRLLWLLLLLLPVTYFIQEMVVRLGIATGKGHAAMIYQRFGKWWGLFSLIDLELVNFLTLVTEFAAIALALGHMGISPNIGVPLSAIALIVIVLTGSYRRWERMTVLLCLLDIAWIAIALRVRPAFAELFHNSFVPGFPAGGMAAQPGDAGSQSARVLRRLHCVRGPVRGRCLDSQGAAAINHPGSAGAGRNHSAFGRHFSAIAVERQRNAGGRVRKRTMEQLGELDHHCRALHPVANSGSPGGGPQFVPFVSMNT